jgi:hypothetical protein
VVNLDILQFRRLDGHSYRGCAFELIAGDDVIAELAPLDDRHGTMVLDAHQGSVVKRAGCWCLDLIRRDGPAEAHLLWPTAETPPDGDGIDGDLIAWATLTVLWATASTAPHRG